MLAQKLISKGSKKLVKLSHINSYKFHVPPGHFYSPLVSDEFIRKYEDRIFEVGKKEMNGIDLNEEQQLNLLHQFQSYYQELPFKEEKQAHLRYALKNEYFDYADGIYLHCMIRHFQPKKIIEIGSGFSSAVTMDTNDLFFDKKIELTFIEPYPDRLKSLLKEDDKIRLFEENVQDVDPSLFTELEANNILFIDTSHVVKTGSEVNYLLFNILPLLKKGVIIHIHDIFFPFEYPKEWVIDQKRGWNEAYMLRAFLMYNDKFKIKLFTSFVEQFFSDWLRQHMPLTLKAESTSLWLSKE